MGIEFKTLIEDTCRQFERNFSAGDLARLVSDYYHPECLVVGEGIGRFEGHEGARGFFGGAIATWSACELITEQIIPTAGGAIEVGSAKLTPREDAAPTTFVYAVSWRRENSTVKVVLDCFAPPAIWLFHTACESRVLSRQVTARLQLTGNAFQT